MKTFQLLLLVATSSIIFSCQKQTDVDLSTPEKNDVSTVAGSGISGFADGMGTAALFDKPKGIAMDASGNLYIADWGNHSIRKIGTDGAVVTVAGTNKAGYVDATGTAARFRYPRGIVADAAGNLYIADTDNNRIRKIAPDGTVTTIAGTGTSGFQDGVGSAAKLNKPKDIAIDAAGNLYIADTENNRIRKITPDGTVTTFAGDGTEGYADATGVAAKFNSPRGIAVDKSGVVYVADTDNNRIRKITPEGVVTTLAGNGKAGYVDGGGSVVKFKKPKGLAIDKSGIIYVADTENNRIRKIAPDGTVTTIAGTGTVGATDGTGKIAEFYYPRSLAIDATNNILYIVDQDNNRIRKIKLG